MKLKQIELALVKDYRKWIEYTQNGEEAKPTAVREHVFTRQMPLQGWVQVETYDPLVEYGRTTYQLETAKQGIGLLRLRNVDVALNYTITSLTDTRIEAMLNGDTMVVLEAANLLEGDSYGFSWSTQAETTQEEETEK